MAIKKHKIIYEQDIDNRKLKQKSKDTQKSFDETGKKGFNAFKLKIAAGITIAVLAFRKLYNAASEWVELANVQARAEVKIAQAIKATGYAAGFTAKQLYDEAAALQEILHIGDEKILNEVTAIFLSFLQIQGEQFKRAQIAALDLSTLLEGDFRSAAIQLGKALNDPVANLSALSRAGIQFSKDQKIVIKALWETGKQAEAQNLILEELERQFGGQAKAVASAVGDYRDLDNALGDFKETLGKALNEGVEPIVKELAVLVKQAKKDGDLQKGLKELSDTIQNLWKFGKGVADTLGYVKDLGDTLNKYSATFQTINAILGKSTDQTSFYTGEIRKLIQAKQDLITEEKELAKAEAGRKAFQLKAKQEAAAAKAEKDRVKAEQEALKASEISIKKHQAFIKQVQADIDSGKEETEKLRQEKVDEGIKKIEEDLKTETGIYEAHVERMAAISAQLGDAIVSGYNEEGIKGAMKQALMLSLDYAVQELAIARIIALIKDGLLGFGTGLAQIVAISTALALVKGEISSFATGTENFGGGFARVHKDEIINMPVGSDVYSKTESDRLMRTGNEVTNNLIRELIQVTKVSKKLKIKGNDLITIYDRANKNKM